MSYYYTNFHPVREQQIAITHPPGPLLIIAGAGTGKTATLLHRIRYQVISNQMTPENILILTFTEKATNELIARLSNLDVPDSEQITISTFHSFCYHIVQNYINPDETHKSLIERHDIAFMILNRINELKFLRSRQFRLHPRDAIENAFIPFFNRVRDELISPADLTGLMNESHISPDTMHEIFPGLSPKVDPGEALNQLHDLIDVYTVFQIWKRESNVVDYGDMIQQCWEGLQNQKVLEQVRKKYKHIIIDEFQDNNYALNKIINHIIEPNPSLTVVGDEDQCIYSFRGANYYNIHDFRNKYQQHPLFREIALETNFRSTQPILHLANKSIANDPERTDKQLRSIASDNDGKKPVWLMGQANDTLNEIVKRINRLIDEGQSFEDMAILCRTTRQVEKIAKYLEQKNIPVQVFRDRLTGIPEIRLFTAWQLALTDSARFATAWAYLLSHYLNKVDKNYLSLEFEDIINFTGNSDTPDHVQWLINNIQELVHKIHQGAKPDEMVWNILDAADLLHDSIHHYRYKDRLTLRNIGYIISQAGQFLTHHPEAGFEQWLLYYDLLTGNTKTPAIEPELTPDVYGVQIMTVHRSKGLEFPAVFLPYLQSASFPLNYKPQTVIDTIPEPWFQWSPESGYEPKLEHLNEERRIFYVAVTRAKQELIISAHDKRLSVFIKELKPYWEEVFTIYQIESTEEKGMNDSTRDPKQILMTELNREISLKKWENADAILRGLKQLEESGYIADDNPYSYVNPLVTSDKPTNHEILVLSASAVDEYNQCPYKYRLNRIDHIPQRKSNAQMAFGIIIHQILYEFHENPQRQSKEYLNELLKKHWIPDAFEYSIREEEFHAQAVEILESYWEYLHNVTSSYRSGETEFSFELTDADIRIVGKIDRIDTENETLKVIDYKTGNKPSINNTKKSLQLALYIEAIRRDAVKGVTGIPGSAQLLYLKNLDDLYEPHDFSEDELEKHLNSVKEAAEGIRMNEFPQKPSDFTCGYCDYKDFLCPAWEND